MQQSRRLVTHRIGVEAQARGERLDLFLARRIAGVSRKKIKRALDDNRVSVDGRVVRRAGQVLVGGEQIVAEVEVDEAPPRHTLEIIFQDQTLLALNKPAGLAVHGGPGAGANALDLVRERLGANAAPILLHRLDQDTSGVLLFALDAAANRELARQFSAREVQKTYLALVSGDPPDSFVVDNHLQPKKRGRTLAVRSGGLAAQTFFTTLMRGEGFALVEARPRTGRTHQIRAHLAGEGFALLGDSLYGGPEFVALNGQTLAVARHLLHAWRLHIHHPLSGAALSLEAPIPQDFKVFPEVESVCRSLPPPHRACAPPE
ncbi:RluA family pseudouridine synthase [Geoalkalibacter halelectricus]|uniref:Pseudouridine synthase n=1 Tax=Geoalkalibacter halelectricus TaxID=2847045 RepID=A0ABY5ZG62_9BACT|nr:RluA family pseudouridine synthase [Geoalkalibacter halelectricus]MDO3379500.1 RluA family pseudouridine synthase [Geoalkalibacter halelectricus]UWZ78091.1 RluA family pseudouridine synthase [Geoalkalibacter halelectricus]